MANLVMVRRFQKPLTIWACRPGSSNGNSLVPFDGQAWMVAQQDFSRLCRIPRLGQLRQRPRPVSPAPEDDWDLNQLLARPGQRGIILSDKVVAERVRCRPLISRIAIARCAAMENRSMASDLAAHEVTHSEDAASPHI